MKDLAVIYRAVQMVTKVYLSNKGRSDEEAFSRYIFCRVARDVTNCSLTEIGKEINRDHSTVHPALKMFDRTILSDKHWQKKYLEVKQLFQELSDDEHEIMNSKNLIELLEIELQKANEKLKMLQDVTGDIELTRLISKITKEDLPLFKETKLIPFLKMRNAI